MKIRGLQPVIDKPAGVTNQSFIALVGHAIHSDKARLYDDVHLSGGILILEEIGKQI